MTPTLLPARRDAYLRALNELVGYLSMHTFKQIDVADFCDQYKVESHFLTALRDLDAIELDLAKLAVHGETWYKRSPSLLDFTPEDVVAQLLRNHVDCTGDVAHGLAIVVKADEQTAGSWIRFFDSRTNEFMVDDLSDTRVADEEPVSDFVRDGLATLEAEFEKADEAADEAGKLREYARLCQKVAHDALRLADSTEQMVAAGLQLNFPLPSAND